ACSSRGATHGRRSSTAPSPSANGERSRLRPSVPALFSRRRELTCAIMMVYSEQMLQSRTDIVVRKPQTSDAEALAELFGLSWRLAYTGIIPHAHLEGIIRRRTVEWWRGVTSRSD